MIDSQRHAALRADLPCRLLLALCCLLFIESAVATDGRHALVIGNAAYQDQKPLVNTLNDARDMAAKLQGLGFDVTEVENADRRRLTRAVNDFIRQVQGSDGVALVYYSGHGVQSNGRNYLLPVDARIQDALDIPTEGLAMDRLLAGLDGRGDAAVNLIILDSCRDNPYSAARGGGDKGLARLAAPSGTLILYATKPGETASDNPGGRNGLFTKHLLAALDRPGVEVEDAFKLVAREVYRDSRKAQFPWLEGLILGRFYFVPPSSGGAPLPGRRDVSPRRESVVPDRFGAPARGDTEPVRDSGPVVAARDGRFIAYDNGTVLDTSTGLMWAATDNGHDINWPGAKSYCESYRGGGFSDWRMPTMSELKTLYDPYAVNPRPATGGCSGGYHVTGLIHLTCGVPWSSERKGVGAYCLSFASGKTRWDNPSLGGHRRVLPVR